MANKKRKREIADDDIWTEDYTEGGMPYGVSTEDNDDVENADSDTDDVELFKLFEDDEIPF